MTYVFRSENNQQQKNVNSSFQILINVDQISFLQLLNKFDFLRNWFKFGSGYWILEQFYEDSFVRVAEIVIKYYTCTKYIKRMQNIVQRSARLKRDAGNTILNT